MTAPLRSSQPAGVTRVGWRNLFSGALNRGNRDPGYGWCPVYVDTKKVWIKS